MMAELTLAADDNSWDALLQLDGEGSTIRNAVFRGNGNEGNGGFGWLCNLAGNRCTAEACKAYGATGLAPAGFTARNVKKPIIDDITFSRCHAEECQAGFSHE